MKTRMTMLLLALAGVALQAQPQPGIDNFLPSLDQLGAGWVSRTIAVLVDPLSSPNEVVDEGWRGLLEKTRKMIKTHERESFARVRYAYGGSNAWVWVCINRYKSKEKMGDDWGRDRLTKRKLKSLPQVGDEVRFCQRNGLHDDFYFRRGNYLIWVEGVTVPIEKLRQFTEVVDANLVKAQKEAAASSSSEPRSQK